MDKKYLLILAIFINLPEILSRKRKKMKCIRQRKYWRIKQTGCKKELGEIKSNIPTPVPTGTNGKPCKCANGKAGPCTNPKISTCISCDNGWHLLPTPNRANDVDSLPYKYCHKCSTSDEFVLVDGNCGDIGSRFKFWNIVSNDVWYNYFLIQGFGEVPIEGISDGALDTIFEDPTKMTHNGGIVRNDKFFQFYINHIDLGPKLSSLFSGYSDKLTKLVLVAADEANQSQIILNGIFDGLSALTRLRLTNYKIEFIANDAFSGLVNLVSLELKMNSIKAIGHDSFKGLTELTELDLAKNSLTVIDEHLFDDLTKLTFLGIESNELTSFGPDTFKYLTALTVLNLEKNKLIDFDNIDVQTVDIFKSLVSLSNLLLNDNKFEYMVPAGFDYLASLTWLKLNGNLFTDSAKNKWTIWWDGHNSGISGKTFTV